MANKTCAGCEKILGDDEFYSLSCRLCLKCESETMRSCGACGAVKSLLEFPVRKDSASGRARTCRQCRFHGVAAQIKQCSGEGCEVLIPAEGNLKFCPDCKLKASLYWKVSPRKKYKYPYVSKTTGAMMDRLMKIDWLRLNKNT